ncbi:SCP2 sterol-binding domain-containing protein [Neptunomonas qingdaonensis]|uniref:Putative sterol carrier protein n=1 Tax=Neptunomonas qingdaonensis TaxID=1045558 RepID=A0A1I2U5I2_9GAMM|nr:SCP2 sterol-binding domain-containing protein [Neptunomonas qingdaonensis]SFG70066.1 Putative sterol carrier protein [Neptunomonas qingdaonensis]
MSDLSNIFEEMKNRFNSAAAAGLDVVFQYQIDDGEPYHVTVSEGNCVVAQGEHDEPSVTLSMDSQTLQEVISGETDGMQAFMTGRIRADGDIMLATRLTALFPVA